jgi:hypothetical protein
MKAIEEKSGKIKIFYLNHMISVVTVVQTAADRSIVSRMVQDSFDQLGGFGAYLLLG